MGQKVSHEYVNDLNKPHNVGVIKIHNPIKKKGSYMFNVIDKATGNEIDHTYITIENSDNIERLINIWFECDKWPKIKTEKDITIEIINDKDDKINIDIKNIIILFTKKMN